MNSRRENASTSSERSFSARAPVIFLLFIVVSVVAGNAFLYLHGPLNGNAGMDVAFSLPAASSAPEELAATGRSPQPAAIGSIEESEWQKDRAEQLLYQRRIEEMLPITPGVTMDQYVQADFSEAAATPEEEEVIEEDIDTGGVPTE